MHLESRGGKSLALAAFHLFGSFELNCEIFASPAPFSV